MLAGIAGTLAAQEWSSEASFHTAVTIWDGNSCVSKSPTNQTKRLAIALACQYPTPVLGDLHAFGIGMLVDKRSQACTHRFHAISDRSCALDTTIGSYSSCMMSIFCPRATYPLECLHASCDASLALLYSHTRNGQLLIVGGDFNPRIDVG